MKRAQRLELLKDFVQEAIDRGATSVEAIHQYIADLPFEALESTGLLRDKTAALRDRHRRTIGTVYDAIRRINREIGQLISDQFENAEETAQAAQVIRSRVVVEPEAAAPAPAPAKKKAAPRKRAATKKTAAKKKPDDAA